MPKSRRKSSKINQVLNQAIYQGTTPVSRRTWITLELPESVRINKRLKKIRIEAETAKKTSVRHVHGLPGEGVSKKDYTTL